MSHGSILVCKRVDLDSDSGRFNIHGITILTRPVDIFLYSLYYVMYPESMGKKQLEVTLSRFPNDPKSRMIKFEEIDITSQDMVRGHIHRVITNQVETMFKEPGKYWFDLKLNGDIIASSPLIVKAV